MLYADKLEDEDLGSCRCFELSMSGETSVVSPCLFSDCLKAVCLNEQHEPGPHLEATNRTTALFDLVASHYIFYQSYHPRAHDLLAFLQMM